MTMCVTFDEIRKRGYRVLRGSHRLHADVAYERYCAENNLPLVDIVPKRLYARVSIDFIFCLDRLRENTLDEVGRILLGAGEYPPRRPPSWYCHRGIYSFSTRIPKSICESVAARLYHESQRALAEGDCFPQHYPLCVEQTENRANVSQGAQTS